MQPLDNIQDSNEGARPIVQTDGQLGNAAFYREAPHDDLIQDIHIDISPGDDGQHLFARKSHFSLQQGGQGNGPRTLRDDLFDLQKEKDGVGRRSLFKAPLSLNDPVIWRFSNLNRVWQPQRSLSFCEWTVGVRTM